MKRVSVILSCYNGAATLEQACGSLYRQTLPLDQYEVLFLDDGSTDGTEQAAKEFTRYPNFRYVRSEANLGLPKTCNRGLALARGAYVIRLDSDDTFEPTILEAMCPFLDQGAADLVTCDRFERAGSTSKVETVRLREFDLYRLIAIGSMMRRSLLLEIGGYRELFWEEYDLYLRYLLRSSKPPRHIARPLFTYSIREGSMTQDPQRVSDGWEELRRLWPQEILERFGRLPVRAGQLHV